MDGRCLSAVLPRSRRRVARGRSCRAGSGEDRTSVEDAADIETDGRAGGTLAAAARRRGSPVVVLLQGDQEARGRDSRAGPTMMTKISRAICRLSAQSQTV